MDIRNIALVRATNIIPFDSIVHPISNVPYLRKERGNHNKNYDNMLIYFCPKRDRPLLILIRKVYLL